MKLLDGCQDVPWTSTDDDRLPEPKPKAVQVRGSTLIVLSLGCAYILVSVGIINFNKFLMHPQRFPYSVPLVTIHMCVCTFLTCLLYLCVPSMFPSLSDPDKRVHLDAASYLKNMGPIAVGFSGSLIFGVQAYMFLSVSFLQMMKEANVVVIYALSLLAGLEVFTSNHFKILALIVIASALTIRGEAHLSMVGFAIQATSQVFECIKAVLQGKLLSTSGMKLDALSFILLMSPMCVVCLVLTLAALQYYAPPSLLLIPSYSEVVYLWRYLAFSAVLVFALNIIIALFIKHTSVVSITLLAVMRDAAVVLVNVLVCGERITQTQAIGFAMQLVLVWVWSKLKLFPQEFEHGIMAGLELLATRRSRNKQLEREAAASSMCRMRCCRNRWDEDEDEDGVLDIRTPPRFGMGMRMVSPPKGYGSTGSFPQPTHCRI